MQVRTAMTCRWIVLACGLLAPACDARKTSAHSEADASAHHALACPSPVLLEELHAATFYFEHGAAGEARDHARRARDMAAHEPLDPTAKATMEALARVDASIEGQPDVARSELELVRLGFREWSCLPEDVHQHFHERLPSRR